MNAYRIFLIALLALVPATPMSSAVQQGSLASIQGTVIDAASNQPVSGAIVELTGIQGGRVLSLTDVTGKDGKFELRDLQPASDYQLTASDNGNYRPSAYGQHKNPNDPWVPVVLTAGQTLSDVRLVLTPISSITGKVVDGAGKSLSRAQVYVLRATYTGGRRVLQQAGSTQTNDSGEYFVGTLEAGQYYVRTTPSSSNPGDYRQLFESPAAWDRIQNKKVGEPEGFPTSYYPGTMDLTAARPVDLLNGGKARNINITVAKVRTRRIGGTVFTALDDVNGQSAAQPASKARVLLVPRTAGSESSFTRSVASEEDGQFEFRGVLPGTYFLVAVVTVNGTQRTARKTLDVLDGVRDTDLQKLSITATRGIDIPGTIRFSDWQMGVLPDYSQLAINLIPDAAAPIDRTFAGTRIIAAPLTVPPSPSGQFVLRDVAPGNYRVIVSLNPKLAADAKLPLDLKAAYMASVRIGDTDVLDNGIQIDARLEGSLQVVVSTSSGSIFGRVLDENKQPTVPARMIVVPEKSRRKRFDLFSTVAVSPTGRFTLDGIPPGNYNLFAWAHVEEGAWFDPEFMRVYEDRGTPLKIEASGAYPIEIPIIH